MIQNEQTEQGPLEHTGIEPVDDFYTVAHKSKLKLFISKFENCFF